MNEANDRAETGMPGATAPFRYRLRFPDNTRIGPFPAQTMIDLYSVGRVPEKTFARREPDGAWLPFEAVFRNVLPWKTGSEKKTVRDRRISREFTIIERRRGRARMFTQIALCASLFIGLFIVLR